MCIMLTVACRLRVCVTTTLKHLRGLPSDQLVVVHFADADEVRAGSALSPRALRAACAVSVKALHSR